METAVLQAAGLRENPAGSGPYWPRTAGFLNTLEFQSKYIEKDILSPAPLLYISVLDVRGQEMTCTKAQLLLFIEYIERCIDSKMRKLGLSREHRQQILLEIEKTKQNIIEYGIQEIQRELGI